MKSKIRDLTGQQFTRLFVLSLDHSGKKIKYVCLCDCGNRILVRGDSLLSGQQKSCGCYKNELLSIMAKKQATHGFSKSQKKEDKRFYKIWKKIKERCLNPNCDKYEDYGGRDIKVCDRWMKSFENFRDDMYESYLKHVEEFGLEDTSIDRIEVMGNYEPSNCKWATWKEQCSNKRTSSQTINLKEHKKWRNILRCLVWKAIKIGTQDQTQFVKYVGCTILEFKSYISSQFQAGMNWSNYGKNTKQNPNVWNFDHAIPIYKFDLSKEADRLVCWNYKNLRPMWATQNINGVR
jgi:hypothetical protein